MRFLLLQNSTIARFAEQPPRVNSGEFTYGKTNHLSRFESKDGNDSAVTFSEVDWNELGPDDKEKAILGFFKDKGNLEDLNKLTAGWDPASKGQVVNALMKIYSYNIGDAGIENTINADIKLASDKSQFLQLLDNADLTKIDKKVLENFMKDCLKPAIHKSDRQNLLEAVLGFYNDNADQLAQNQMKQAIANIYLDPYDSYGRADISTALGIIDSDNGKNDLVKGLKGAIDAFQDYSKKEQDLIADYNKYGLVKVNGDGEFIFSTEDLSLGQKKAIFEKGLTINNTTNPSTPNLLIELIKVDLLKGLSPTDLKSSIKDYLKDLFTDGYTENHPSGKAGAAQAMIRQIVSTIKDDDDVLKNLALAFDDLANDGRRAYDKDNNSNTQYSIDWMTVVTDLCLNNKIDSSKDTTIEDMFVAAKQKANTTNSTGVTTTPANVIPLADYGKLVSAWTGTVTSNTADVVFSATVDSANELTKNTATGIIAKFLASTKIDYAALNDEQKLVVNNFITELAKVLATNPTAKLNDCPLVKTALEALAKLGGGPKQIYVDILYGADPYTNSAYPHLPIKDVFSREATTSNSDGSVTLLSQTTEFTSYLKDPSSYAAFDIMRGATDNSGSLTNGRHNYGVYEDFLNRVYNPTPHPEGYTPPTITNGAFTYGSAPNVIKFTLPIDLLPTAGVTDQWKDIIDKLDKLKEARKEAGNENKPLAFGVDMVKEEVQYQATTNGETGNQMGSPPAVANMAGIDEAIRDSAKEITVSQAISSDTGIGFSGTVSGGLPVGGYTILTRPTNLQANVSQANNRITVLKSSGTNGKTYVCIKSKTDNKYGFFELPENGFDWFNLESGPYKVTVNTDDSYTITK